LDFFAEGLDGFALQERSSDGQSGAGLEEGRRILLFVFNDTIEGPRAPAVKPGRITQA
jgi:hypothetical protein